MYFVGWNGTIIHYDGVEWRRIESGTDLQFLDIYGATDSKTGEQQILAVCTRNYPLGQAIFRIQGSAASQISSYPVQWELWSAWFAPNRHYYVVGAGIYEKHFLSDSVWRNGPLDITRYGTTKIRGNALNDVVVVGAFGEWLHYNGVSWKSFHNVTGFASGAFASVAVRGNLTIAVGQSDARAIIANGMRQ